MATTAGRESSALNSTLPSDSKRYSFEQAYRLLVDRVVREGGDPQQDIVIRPTLSLSPARTEVDAMLSQTNEAGRVRYELQTNILGLYGASSPLPHFITEELIEAEQQDENGGRVMLDLLHQSLFRLFYQARTRYRPMADQANHATYLGLFRSLLGVRDEHLWRQFPRQDKLFQFINIYRHQRGSAMGLQRILAGLFEGSSVVVEQCVERTMDIPVEHSLRLGLQAHELGENTLVGDECFDYAGMFSVRIEPVQPEVYAELVESETAWNALIRLIRYFLLQPLVCRLNIRVAVTESLHVELGSQGWNRLGANSWLFRADNDEPGTALLPVIEATLTLE